MKRNAMLTVLITPFMIIATARAAEQVSKLIDQVAAVKPEGAGAAQARRARDALAAMGPGVLPDLLAGMDTPDTVAANWLRTAFDEIVERTAKTDPEQLPAEEIRKFFLDPRRQGRARRLALAVLTRLDASAPARAIPALLDDPEFRYDAVAAVLQEGEQAKKERRTADAINAFTKAFNASRDEGQVRTAAQMLSEAGREVSVVDHLGYLTDWFLVGPFDGPDFAAFSMVYPPENKIDLEARYEGKSGPIGWNRHRTADQFGTVNIAAAIAQVDAAVAYGFTTVESDRRQPLQMRCGADDNVTVWLNGEKVFAKEEWKNGTRFDRFQFPITLREGTNRILVKVCNAPPYADPTLGNPWSVQVRICDQSGKGVVFPELAELPARGGR